MQAVRLPTNFEPYFTRLTRLVLSIYRHPDRASVAAEVMTHAGCRVVRFEGSGHWMHQEGPIEVVA